MTKPDKPRLYLRHGIWCCRVPGRFQTGHGYSPSEAYLDWQQVMRCSMHNAEGQRAL
jgi:ribosomal protein L37AE/L43A